GGSVGFAYWLNQQYLEQVVQAPELSLENKENPHKANSTPSSKGEAPAPLSMVAAENSVASSSLTQSALIPEESQLNSGTDPGPGNYPTSLGQERDQSKAKGPFKQLSAVLAKETIPTEGAERLDLGAVYALKDHSAWLEQNDLEHLAVQSDEVGGRPVKHYLDLEAGLSLIQNWNNVSSTERGFHQSPTLGLTYGYAIRPGVRLQTGIRYQSRAGLDSDTTFVNRNFGFGIIDTLSRVSPQRLHQVAIPLLLDIRVHNRHYLRAGLQANLLIDASGRLIRSQATEAGVTEFSNESRWGYRQGFQPWDVNVSVGYHYYLGQGWRVGLTGLYGLRDQTREEFYGNGQINRQVELRVQLSYNLWRR
ncbi:MAG: outer membrane beta-barrel protein, partial [Bacteroidota bacterium]